MSRTISFHSEATGLENRVTKKEMCGTRNYFTCLFVGCAVRYVFGINSEQVFVQVKTGINSCLDTYLISSDTDHTAISCGLSCNQEAVCKSYVFATDTFTCSLYSKYLTSDVAPDVTKLYYVRQDAAEKYVPSTCKDVKDVGHTTDGEYWLYPKAWNTSLGRIKIYCHELGTETPSEFVSLTPGTNIMFEGGSSPHNIAGSSIVFNQVKIDINTMTIDTTSLTFANPSTPHTTVYSGSSYINYGQAVTCWFFPSDIPGTATMDTAGTGLIINPDLLWYAKHGTMTTFTRNGSKIVVGCSYADPECGFCYPSGDIVLQLNPSEVLNLNKATLLCE